MPYSNPSIRRENNKIYQKTYYIKNKSYYKIKNHERRDSIKALLTELKTDKGCIKCGESNPLCLDFHHKDPTTKTVNVSEMGRRGWSIERIIEEINKCDVLCANCHRKEHNKAG